MKGVVASLAGAIVISCGGCGGGGGSSTPVVAAKAPTHVLIEAYGDSTTAGHQEINGVGSETPNSEPVELQKNLQAQFGSAVTVTNNGVGATEASQLLNGTDGVHPAWLNQMNASKASIVTLNFALNDAYYSSVVTDGKTAETPQAYGDVLVQLIRTAKAAGKQIVLDEPNPTCEPVRAPLMEGYVAVLRSVAKSENVPLVAEYDYIQSLPNWQALLTDCLHPTDSLYKIKADREAAVIAPLVQTLTN